MKLLSRNDRAGLKHFGLTLAVLLPLLFGLVLPWLFSHSRPAWPFYSAVIFAALSFIAPRALYPLYRAWMAVARVLGLVTNTLILTSLFVLLFIPLGLVLRLLGKLQYATGFDSGKTSYRVAQRREFTAEDLENPF